MNGSETLIPLRCEFEALSACLRGQSRKVLSICSSEDFEDETNKNATWAIQKLLETGAEISIGAIVDVLKLNGKYGEDSLSFIEHSALIEGIDGEAAAKLVKERAARHRESELFKELAKKLDAGELTSSQAATTLMGQIFSIAAPSSEPSKPFSQIAVEAEAKLVELQAGRVVGYTTSLPTVDRMLMKIHPKEFVMIMGPPGSLKSLFAEKLILANALAGVPCAAYVLEMSDGEWMERAIMQFTDRISNANKFRGSLEYGKAAFTEAEAQEVLRVTAYVKTLPIFVSDQKFTEFAIHEDIIRRVENDGVKIVVVDQAQLVSRGDGNNRVNELEAISRGFRLIALKYNIVVVLLSKMNKAGIGAAFRGEELSGSEMAGTSAFESDGSIILSMTMRKAEFLCECPDEEMIEFKRNNKGRPKHPTNEFVMCRDCGAKIFKAPRRLGWLSILKARAGEIDDRINLVFTGAKLRLEERERPGEPEETVRTTRAVAERR
jgi:replicative DNA helicase